MRYLAININYDLDQDWYCKLPTVSACHSYFKNLGAGHGPKVAIYDIKLQRYSWIDESQPAERIRQIVQSAATKPPAQFSWHE